MHGSESNTPERDFDARNKKQHEAIHSNEHNAAIKKEATPNLDSEDGNKNEQGKHNIEERERKEWGGYKGY